MMSRDRWSVWEINDKYELVEYEPAVIEEIDDDIKIEMNCAGPRRPACGGFLIFTVPTIMFTIIIIIIIIITIIIVIVIIVSSSSSGSSSSSSMNMNIITVNFHTKNCQTKNL